MVSTPLPRSCVLVISRQLLNRYPNYSVRIRSGAGTQNKSKLKSRLSEAPELRALKLKQYQFDVQYQSGKLNVVTDALSRQPLDTVQQAEVEPSQCKWTRKMTLRVNQEPEKFSDYRLFSTKLNGESKQDYKDHDALVFGGSRTEHLRRVPTRTFPSHEVFLT